MKSNDNSACDRVELVRDYAFDELAPTERAAMAQHLTACHACASELDSLRLTTAVLRVLPDVEVPRRIAFVSDAVAKPGWFAGFWNSSARLGFAAACVLSVGLSFTAWRRAADPQPVVRTAAVSQAEIDAAVQKAVTLAVEKTHAEDVRITQAALDAVDSKYAQKQQNLMMQMAASLDYLKKKNQFTALSSFVNGPGVAQ